MNEKCAIVEAIRVWHRYGKTHGDSKTGIVGMGTVVDFGIPWHTATCTCSITVIHGYITVR